MSKIKTSIIATIQFVMNCKMFSGILWLAHALFYRRTGNRKSWSGKEMSSALPVSSGARGQCLQVAGSLREHITLQVFYLKFKVD